MSFTKHHSLLVFLLVTLSVGITPKTFASVWLEPYAGYEFSDHKQGSTSYDANGLNLGFRAGMTYEPAYFGLEYVLADLTVDKTSEANIKTTDWGLFVGASFSVVRLWLTYWLSSEGNSDNPSVKYSGDAGYKIGLGFNIFSQVSFNVEKTLRIWRKSDGTKMANRIEIDGFLLSLSLPFTF